MARDGDAEHFARHAAVEALDHAVGLGRVRLGLAVLHLQFAAGLLETIGGEARTPVGEHMRDLEGDSAIACLRKAIALSVVSSSFTARCTEREQRSMATERKRLRASPSAVLSFGRCLMSMCTKPRS